MLDPEADGQGGRMRRPSLLTDFKDAKTQNSQRTQSPKAFSGEPSKSEQSNDQEPSVLAKCPPCQLNYEKR